jgi:hypothetical protein
VVGKPWRKAGVKSVSREYAAMKKCVAYKGRKGSRWSPTTRLELAGELRNGGGDAGVAPEPARARIEVTRGHPRA